MTPSGRTRSSFIQATFAFIIKSFCSTAFSTDKQKYLMTPMNSHLPNKPLGRATRQQVEFELWRFRFILTDHINRKAKINSDANIVVF
jgi:hypothetical protein